MNKKVNKGIFLSLFAGFLAGMTACGILVYVYEWSRTPPDMRQLCRIKGYEKLDQDQTADIRKLSGVYEIEYINQELSEAVKKKMPIEDYITHFGEDSEVEFIDLRNADFAGKSYRAVEVYLYDWTRYEGTASYPEMSEKVFGTKDVMEIRYEEKNSESGFFLVIISAGGDVFFVPPEEMRTEETGYIYWTMYPLRDEKEPRRR